MVLSTLLKTNTRALYETIVKWSNVFPPVFDVEQLLNQFSSVSCSSTLKRGKDTKPLDAWCLESQAFLLTILKEPSKALQCYLSIIENSAELSKDYGDDYADVTDGITGPE